MKTLFVIAALAVGQLVAAQKTVEIKKFSTLAVSGNIELTLIKSSENKAVISEGEDSLRIGTDEGVLALSNNGGETAEIKIYHDGRINEIALSGSVEMNATDGIKSNDLTIAAASGTEINIVVDAKKLTMAIASGAEMNISGKAKDLDVNVASGAEMWADKLKCENSNVVIASGAEASVFTSGTIDATVASGGELTIYGNPKKINEVKDSSAEIHVVR